VVLVVVPVEVVMLVVKVAYSNSSRWALWSAVVWLLLRLEATGRWSMLDAVQCAVRVMPLARPPATGAHQCTHWQRDGRGGSKVAAVAAAAARLRSASLGWLAWRIAGQLHVPVAGGRKPLLSMVAR
jgi:hypothetical protein